MPVPTMLDVDDGLHLLLTERDLGLLQLSTVLYYLHESNPDNGLVRDKTDPKSPVTIAAVGMALATIPGVVERGVLFRDFAAKITLKRLRYLRECPQGPNRMRPATKASSVISWTSRPAAASGSASSPPSTRRSCSRARRGEGVRDRLGIPSTSSRRDPNGSRRSCYRTHFGTLDVLHPRDRLEPPESDASPVA